MVSYINMFLKTEITVIPGLLDKYVGNYYNNTLCNGATWMLVTWLILHFVFDDLLNALFRRMKYKEYIRIRLQRSLWYIGFYITACIYCFATLCRNDLQIINMKEPFDSTRSPSGHLVLGFIVLLTFYLHSALWEKLKYNDGKLSCNYLCLSLLLSFSYFLRFVEGIFRLTIFICSTQVALEMCRCTAVKKSNNSKNISKILLVFSLSVYIVNYLILVPVIFGFPLVKKLSADVGILLICLTLWLGFELYTSVLVKALRHWKHKTTFCEKDVFECSFLSPWNDATYNFLLLRKEMLERKQESESSRKPKNRNVVFQTLKCMVAIKRKLHEKRRGNFDSLQKVLDQKEQNVDTENDDCDDASCEAVVGGRLEFNINKSESSN